MQVRGAFYIFASLHHVYAVSRLLFLHTIDTDDAFMHMVKNKAYCFFTLWNMILQILYFTGCGLDAALQSSMPMRSVWKKGRDTVFQAIIFPFGLVVPTIFWAIYMYDRSLVYPEILDEFIPTHVNHFLHTSVAVFVVLEILLRPHHYSKENYNMLVQTAVATCYFIVFHWTYVSTGIWVYPLYNYLSWPQRIFMTSLAGYIAPYGYYILGEKIAQSYWGKLSNVPYM